ncbi:hypothetical protein ACLOJK_031308 [Asimina triloba]
MIFRPLSKSPKLETFCWAVSRKLSAQACQLLDGMPQRDLSSYNRLLFDYSRRNLNQEAVGVFLDIRRSDVAPDAYTLSSILKVCSCLSNLVLGKQIHCHCIKCGLEADKSVGTSLIDTYMKCDSVDDGKKWFDLMPERNVVTWTTMISGYMHNGLPELVLELFLQMQAENIKPNPFTFTSVLAALAAQGAYEEGTQVHVQAIKFGCDSTVSVGNSLINMYSKSGFVREAWALFERMENPNEVSWNGMISGLLSNGFEVEALKLFQKMRLVSMKLKESTFATTIKVCANLKELNFARQLHCFVVKNGFVSNINVRTNLMTAYSKCSKMDDAYDLFLTLSTSQNVVSWTATICGYLHNGEIIKAAHLFCGMGRGDIRPNHFTYSSILTASPAISPFQIHAQVVKTNYESLSSVGTALLSAYAKLGYISEAAAVFELIDDKDIVAWSAMLVGYAQIGDAERAIELFCKMCREGIRPNEFTFSSVVNACSSPMAAVEQGKQLHACLIKAGFRNAICVSSALLTMYAKRGSIESAHAIFVRQLEQDLISWNSMISGYAQHGYGKKALEIFGKMQQENLEMDEITFIGVISACTHAGLVEEGKRYFYSMTSNHGINPTMEHYACMVDLYGRAGKLEEAMNLINGMPFPAGATVWRTLLGACRVHKNIQLGKLAADHLLSLEPHDSAAYVLLSNIYAASGKWEERAKIRKLMEDQHLKKETGYSWIELKNKTHSFMAGDRSHPLTNSVYTKLEELNTRLKNADYIPDTNFVLHDIEEEQKEAILSQHSERLAIAFGLIATPVRTPLQIVKNLRVCGDCHTVIKLISKIEERDIVVRDTNRFHHFKGDANDFLVAAGDGHAEDLMGQNDKTQLAL